MRSEPWSQDGTSPARTGSETAANTIGSFGFLMIVRAACVTGVVIVSSRIGSFASCCARICGRSAGLKLPCPNEYTTSCPSR